MSGLPPIATELRTSMEVRFVPICDIARLLKMKEAANEAANKETPPSRGILSGALTLSTSDGGPGA